MTENLKVFFEQLSQNQALKDELEALSKEYPDKEQLKQNKAAIVQKTLEITAKHGLTLTTEDFEAMEAEAAKIGDLTEEQLQAAAGGGACACVFVGGGGGGGLRGFCLWLGRGSDGDGGKCICIQGGGGIS